MAENPSMPVSCWAARPEDMACHYAIRQRVFVEEQGVMVFTDLDSVDDQKTTIHVVAARGNQLAGTVRLYPLADEGVWKGDRLAVLPRHRSSLAGLRLVRFAVATAAAAGGQEMVASVQTANTVFFERLGWYRDGPEISYYGLPHQPMRIALPGAVAAASGRPESPELLLPYMTAEDSPILVAG